MLGEAEYPPLKFAIELVERLGIEHGFDPAELVSGRTHESLGPFLERMCTLVRCLEESAPTRHGRSGREPIDRSGRA